MSAPRDQSCPLNEQAVGWALHALEPDEEIALLLHVPQCGSCQDVLRHAEDVLAHLGPAVEQIDPSPALRAAIISAAEETPQRPPLLRPRASPESTPPVEAATPRHRADPGKSVRPPARKAEPRQRRSIRRGLIAASVAFVGALAFVGVVAIGGLAARTAQLEQQRDAETSQAQSISDLVAQLQRPGVKHALLADDGGGPPIAAVVVADGQRKVFTIGLSANAADRDTYVLWGTGAGAAPQALGTFDVTAADRGVRTVGSAAEADGFTGYAISLESGRTPPASPSTVVAMGQVEI